MAYYNGRLTLGGVAGVFASVDDALSDTSENPVQNKVITNNACLKADVVQTVTPSTNYNNENPISAKAVHTAIRANAYLASGGKNGTLTAAERAKIAYIPDKNIYDEAPAGTVGLSKNTYYSLGILTDDISLALPTGGAYGDEIRVDFFCGATAKNVTIDVHSAAHTALSYTPTANTAYSIYMTFGAIGANGEAGWRIETKTFAGI